MKRIPFILSVSTLFIFNSCDTLQVLQTGMPGQTTSASTGSTTGVLTNNEAHTGIKQALSQGLNRSIETLALKDGFLGNASVKILMPEEAQRVERTLRGIGLGQLCDQFITQLNRAAESAVKEAAPVFVQSLNQLTLQDAMNILLSGQTDAATSFFKRTTSQVLTSKFSPIVEQALGQHQVAKYWSELVTRYNQIPLVNEKIETDLNAYVTSKAIDGLFTQVAQEELKIRQNLSGSRSTPLLQKVFGYADQQKN
jgi:hypothetical protein